jgi:hypothetical protein
MYKKSTAGINSVVLGIGQAGTVFSGIEKDQVIRGVQARKCKIVGEMDKEEPNQDTVRLLVKWTKYSTWFGEMEHLVVIQTKHRFMFYKPENHD